MNLSCLHSNLLEKDRRTGWKATFVEVEPQLGTFATPYKSEESLRFKVNCIEQPSIEVAERIEVLVKLDDGVTES